MLASRLHWRLLIGTIVVLIAALWLAPRWIRPPDIQENRVLAEMPAWPTTLGGFEAFRKDADAYVADHFPARPLLIGTLNRVRMLARVSGSNRVIVGRDGWLFFDDETHLGGSRNDPPMDRPEIRNWLVNFAARSEMLKARGISYLVVAAPVKETIYPQHAPEWYHPTATRTTLMLPKLAAQAGAGDVLYLHPYVAAATARGEKTYSRHDTHWTGYGAYAGYVGLMGRLHAMGLTDEARPITDFELMPPSPIRPRDLALMLGVASFVDVDFPHIDNLTGGGKIKVTYLTPKEDWTAPQVIDTGEVGKPVLLMTRNSFSNELVPFLYSHFSRIVLAHNQDGSWRPDLIDQFKPNVVILEVVEHGLRVSMGAGPQVSPAAAARIDATLDQARIGLGPPPPRLASPDAVTLAALNSASKAGHCTVDVAKLTANADGEGLLTVAGWLSELRLLNTSPEGMVRLRGPGFDMAAPMRIDVSRPDVAKAFHNPGANFSGYTREFHVTRPPPGAYRVTVYRRAHRGDWLACDYLQPLALPATP